MGLLFINYTDGLFRVSKKARLEDFEEHKVTKLLAGFGLKKELFEIQDDGVIIITLGGYSYYVEDRSRYSEIYEGIMKILLEDKGRQKASKDLGLPPDMS